MEKIFNIIFLHFSKVSNILGIEWAPINTPKARRLQTLGAMGVIYFMLFGEALAIYLFLTLAYSSLWWVAIVYGIWMLRDIDICSRGGRK